MQSVTVNVMEHTGTPPGCGVPDAGAIPNTHTSTQGQRHCRMQITRRHITSLAVYDVLA